MATRHKLLLDRLEQWAPTVFLLAGGLWLLALALTALGMALGTSMQGPSSIAGFTGGVLSFIGLLGLYPRIADPAPRLARVGVVLLLFPIAFTAVLLVWHVPMLFTSEIPSLLVFLPSPPLVYGALFFLSAVGITIFGVAGMYTGALPGRVGGLVLVVAAGWFLLLGAMAVYTGALPDWVANLQALLSGVALSMIGYVLRTEPESTDRTGRSADAPA